MVQKRRVKLPWWAFDAIEDRTPLRVHWVTGGLGAGKSHGGQIWDIKRCLENGVAMTEPKPSKSWTVAPNYRICETLLDLTLQVAQDNFGMREGTHFKLFRSFPRVVDFSPMGKNHRMSFLSADNPEHFVSESISHWRWSEVGVSKAQTYEKLMDRLRDKRAKCLQGLGDGTPEGMNHFADLANFIGTDPKRNFRRFIVETGDNAENLAPGYLEALRQRYAYDRNKLLSYEKGLFVSFTKGSAYWEFFESRNILREKPYISPNLPILYCWDFNKSPLAHSVMQRQPVEKNFDRYHRFVSLWESHGESRGLMDACAEFGARFPLGTYRDTVIELYGGHDGWNDGHNIDACDWETIKKYLKRIGYRNVVIKADRAAPAIRASLEKVAALMTYELYLVSPECPKIIQSFAKTKLKKGMWDIEKPSDEDWTHWGDGPRYCLFQMNKERNIVDPTWSPTLGVNI